MYGIRVSKGGSFMQGFSMLAVRRRNFFLNICAMAIPLAFLVAMLSQSVFAQNTFVITDGDQVIVHTTYASDPAMALNEAGVKADPDEYYTTQSEDGVYDITARGYGVTLPSVTVFPTTETKYITNTIEREVLVRKWDFYLGGGIYGFNNKVAPMVGLCVKTPNRWLLSANVGICDNKFAYGASVYYRLGKK